MSMTRKEIYLASVDRMARELRDCRDKFQFYGDNHIAKDPPQIAKARVNYEKVAEINLTLAHVGELLAGLDTAEDAASPAPVT